MTRFTYLITLLIVSAAMTACAPQGPSVRLDANGLKQWQISTRAATKLVARGEYDLALKKAEQALVQVKQQPDNNVADRATVLSKIGWINRLMYRHKHSESYYLQSLRLREQVFGKDHPEYADSLLGLGLAYQNQQRREEAIRILEWSLALADKHLGAANQQTNAYIVALAGALEDNFDFNNSLPLRQRSETLLLRQHGENNKLVADARWRLAIAARQAGQPALATKMFDSALASYRRVGGENPELASRIQVAADASRLQSRFGRAESMLKEALRIRLNHIGYDHPEVVSNFEALADMYRDMGRIDDSLKYRSYAQRARNGLEPY